MPSVKVNDAQATHAKPHTSINEHAVVVRPAVNHGVTHALHDLRISRLVSHAIHVAGYPAHQCTPTPHVFTLCLITRPERCEISDVCGSATRSMRSDIPFIAIAIPAM